MALGEMAWWDVCMIHASRYLLHVAAVFCWLEMALHIHGNITSTSLPNTWLWSTYMYTCNSLWKSWRSELPRGEQKAVGYVQTKTELVATLDPSSSYKTSLYQDLLFYIIITLAQFCLGEVKWHHEHDVMQPTNNCLVEYLLVVIPIAYHNLVCTRMS